MPLSLSESDIKTLTAHRVFMALPLFGEGKSWSTEKTARMLNVGLLSGMYEIRRRKDLNEAVYFPLMEGLPPFRIAAEVMQYIDLEQAAQTVLAAMKAGYELRDRTSAAAQAQNTVGFSAQYILLLDNGDSRPPDVWGVDPKVVQLLRDRHIICQHPECQADYRGPTCVGCGFVEAECECAQFDSERK